MNKRLQLPQIVWQSSKQQHIVGTTSIVIAAIRGIAAVEVVAAHLRALGYPGTRHIVDPSAWYQAFAFATAFAHQAVLMFFVISGWLVGGSLLDKWQQPAVLKHYMMDRVSRLWTVLIPTFALTLALAALAGKVDTGALDSSPANPYSASAFIGNLLGLQLISVPNFGENFPLWSLSNETWYYLMFPLLLVLLRTRSICSRACAGLCLAGLVLFLPATLQEYFAIWLLGALGSRLHIKCARWTRYSLVAALAVWSLFCRAYGYNDDVGGAAFKFDFVLSVLLVTVLCSLQSTEPLTSQASKQVTRVANFFANFSFTLYVVHVPLISFILHFYAMHMHVAQLSPHQFGDFLLYCAALVTTTVFAWLFSLLFERRTSQVRSWLKQRVFVQSPAITQAKVVS